MKDSHIQYLEDTVAELKAHIELESSPTDEIRLKANLYDKIKDVISEAIMFTIITFLTVDVGIPGEPSRLGFIWSQGVGCWLSYEIANKITKKRF